MDQPTVYQPYPHSHLFTVRLWVERFDDGEQEVRMQVKHVLSGETRYFRDWVVLTAYLLEKLREGGAAPSHGEL